MLFNKPILLNLSEEAEIVSVKEIERAYRVDIGGTWLYNPTVFESAEIRVFIRVRYNGTNKEIYRDLIDKVSVFDNTSEQKVVFNLGSAIDAGLDFVHIKVLDIVENIKSEKLYFVRVNVEEEILGNCEIYVAFPTFSSEKDVEKLFKRIIKKINKRK